MTLNTKITGKKILIFGGTGSLGVSLIERYQENNRVIVVSRGEERQWAVRNSHPSKNIQFIIGDIRDASRVEDIIRSNKPNIIIVAAAIKHIGVAEDFPKESVLTNVMGPLNVIEAVNRLQLLELQTVLFVSTDKACAPQNTYGMCKALAERIVLNNCISYESPKFIAVRYGNIWKSRGSIGVLFEQQAIDGKDFTITHPEMTRYFMTLDQSADLINSAINHGVTGETWIPILPSMKILDLAEIYAEKYNRSIKEIGIRPGEKIHEMLVSKEDSIRTRCIGTHYVISPAINPTYELKNNKIEPFEYTSANGIISKNELKDYLKKIV